MEPRTCQRCGEQHFNFQKCRVRENQKQGLSEWKRKPNLPEGQRVWGQQPMESVERHGDLIVRKSRLREGG